MTGTIRWTDESCILRAVVSIVFCAYFGAYFRCVFWSVINRNMLEIGLLRQRYRKTIVFNKSNPLAIRRYITYELSSYRNPYLLLLRSTIHTYNTFKFLLPSSNTQSSLQYDDSTTSYTTRAISHSNLYCRTAIVKRDRWRDNVPILLGSVSAVPRDS